MEDFLKAVAGFARGLSKGGYQDVEYTIPPVIRGTFTECMAGFMSLQAGPVEIKRPVFVMAILSRNSRNTPETLLNMHLHLDEASELRIERAVCCMNNGSDLAEYFVKLPATRVTELPCIADLQQMIRQEKELLEKHKAKRT